MKKSTVIIVILLGVGVLIYYANDNINIFNKVSIDNSSKFCYPNSQIEEGKIFFVVDTSITNESNRNIKFKVKILPRDKELIKLIGEERQLTKESQNSYILTYMK